MPRQAATTGRLPQAFEGVKEIRQTAGHLPRGRGLPAQRPRRPARLLPLPDPCRAKTGLGESVPRYR